MKPKTKLPLEFTRYFNEVRLCKDTLKKYKVYAFDLRDESDFLITESYNLKNLIESGYFIFGIEKSKEEIIKNIQEEPPKRNHKETVIKAMSEIKSETQRQVDNVLDMAEWELESQYELGRDDSDTEERYKNNLEDYETVKKLIKSAPNLLQALKAALPHIPYGNEMLVMYMMKTIKEAEGL